MKHKTSKHLDLLFNHFILIYYGSEHNNWLSSTNKIIIPNNFRAMGEEIYLTFALCTLPFALILLFALCTLPFYLFLHFALIKNTAPAASEVIGI